MSSITLICLVNYKRGEDTVACINSLLKIQDSCFHIVVCDNSPTHPSSETLRTCLKEFSKTPSDPADEVDFSFEVKNTAILYTERSDNPGFAGGNNHCIQHFVATRHDISPTHYWFLNNDTEVAPDALSQMLSRFHRPGHKVGACGSTMIYFHDKRTVQALGGSTYSPWSGTMREIGNGKKWPIPVSEKVIESQLAYLCGASMLVCEEFLREVGLMNEEYFLFFEEIDWCERGRRKGFSYVYASDALVFHKEGVAIGTGTGARRSLLAEYCGMRNKLLVTWRFFPWAFPSVWLIGWMQAVRRLIQRRPANAWLMAKVLCGLGKRPV